MNSAELAHLLNLDPSTRLQTGEVPIQVLPLVDPKEPLPKLLQVAARNRPEVMAAAAAISASRIRVRQEMTRPLFPLLIAGFSADDFGGGAVASTSGNVFNPQRFPIARRGRVRGHGWTNRAEIWPHHGTYRRRCPGHVVAPEYGFR